MTEASSTAAPGQGLLSRVIGVIFSPKATFERLVPAPKVLGVLLFCGIAVGLGQGVPQLTETGTQASVQMQAQQMERFTGRPLSEEQYANLQRSAPIRAYATIAGAPISLAIISTILAGIYYVIFNAILGGTASFKQVLGVTAHAGIITALGAAIAGPVMLMQGSFSALGPFTLGAVLPMLPENSFIARFLAFIDVFRIWGTIVTAIGFGVLYRRNTSSIAIGLFALIALFAAIGATVMGLFSR